STLSFTATASDPDLPPNTLSFSLDPGSPAGATIDVATGVFSWTPSASGTFPVTARGTDNGSPPMSDTETFAVTVGALFHGLAHYPAGVAALIQDAQDILRVTGIGNSGGDGVDIALPDGTSALE